MSKRFLNYGPLLQSLDEADLAELGWSPEEERVRLVTRTREQAAAKRGSMVSLEMSVDQLRRLVLTGAELLDMIDKGRVPGDRPLDALVEERRDVSADPAGAPFSGKES